MAPKKKNPPTSCTFCGKPAASMTRDHVFPKALWSGGSNDRAPIAPSCKKCNNESNESILKHFFCALDSRFYSETLRHLKTPEGKGDLRTFLGLWKELGENFFMYLDDKVTGKFVKMFMGVRRHLLGKENWFYVPPEKFMLFKIDKENGVEVVRSLPLKVGGPNQGIPIYPELVDILNEPMRHKFRDFRFECFADDQDGMMLGLKYDRDEFAHLGNRLYLVCFVPKLVKES